jgi:hypothetical protein
MDYTQQAMNVLNCAVNGLSIQPTSNYQDASNQAQVITTGSNYSSITYPQQDGISAGTTLWNYWQNQYYPYVILESYPIYIQEKAIDKGKLAFELLKALMDKGLVKVDKVKDFIEAMDTILKTL